MHREVLLSAVYCTKQQRFQSCVCRFRRSDLRACCRQSWTSSSLSTMWPQVTSPVLSAAVWSRSAGRREAPPSLGRFTVNHPDRTRLPDRLKTQTDTVLDSEWGKAIKRSQARICPPVWSCDDTAASQLMTRLKVNFKRQRNTFKIVDRSSFLWTTKTAKIKMYKWLENKLICH